MKTIERTPGVALAYEFQDGEGPVTVFCSGYGSDMAGTKAIDLSAFCKSKNAPMLRFDYAGHGASGGIFTDGCIGDWTADAAFIISHVIPGREIILVGSSMGGWVALLLGKELGSRLRAVVLIAPAPDFTEILIRPALTPEAKRALKTRGMFEPPSDYGPPLPITLRLLDDGKEHLLLDHDIPITCPVRILHGMQDRDVPYQLSLRLAKQLVSSDVQLLFVKDGGHRLSRDADLLLLRGLVAGFFS